MWVLLSGGLRRWIIFSLAVPLVARLLGSAGRRLEAGKGPTRLSRTLQGAGRLASTRGRQVAAEADPEKRVKNRRSPGRKNR